MARRDALSAAGLAVLAVAYLLGDRQYPLDTLATPGPGVFPLAVGAGVLVLAICQAVGAARGRPGPGPAATPEDVGLARRRPLVLIVVLALFAGVAGTVGFLAASFALVLVSSRILGARDWWRPAVLAAGVTAAAYVIFIGWLGVPLPAGLLR